MSGDLVSHYRILGQIGTSETGVVYKARDTRQNRQVALKFLPAGAAHDPAVLERFRHEAQAVIAINHPNITLFDFGEHEGRPFLVMEYLEGATLAQVIAATAGGNGLPLEPLLRLAIQVAGALDAAHEQGLIHGDISPKTIFVTTTGDAKIMDFGLAGPGTQSATAAVENALADPEAPGEPLYLAPEQLKGNPPDARTDIFSFGAVLYEMATGVPPFQGITKGGVTDAILTRTPLSPSRAGLDLPPLLEQAIYTSIEKNRDVRFENAAQLRNALRRVERQLRTAAQAVAQAAEAPPEKSYRWVLYLVGGLALLAVLGFAVERISSARHTAFETVLISRVTHSGNAVLAAISPDQSSVAYIAREADQESLWLHSVKRGGDTQILKPAPVTFRTLLYSSDGAYLSFERRDNGQSAIFRMPSAGGPERRLFTIPSDVIDASLSPDGQHVSLIRKNTLQDTVLFVDDLDTGVERRIAAWKFPEVPGGSAAWSRDGESIALAVEDYRTQTYDLVSVSRHGGMPVRVATSPDNSLDEIRWMPDSRALIARMEKTPGQNQLWLAPRTTGNFRPITNDARNYSSASIAADGKALIAILSQTSSTIWVASGAGTGDAGPYTDEARQITKGASDSSPVWLDGARLIYLAPGIKEHSNIWMTAIEGGPPRQITPEGARNTSPTVCGKFLVFASNRTGHSHIYRALADGSDVRQLTVGAGELLPSCSPDGTWIAYGAHGPDGVWRTSIDGADTMKILDKYGWPRVSPDGTSVLISTTPDAPLLITAAKPDAAAEPESISVPGSSVRWGADGMSLLYVKTEQGVGNIWRMGLHGGPPGQMTAFTSGTISAFALSPDGKQLAVARQSTPVNDVMLIRDAK